MYVFARVSRLLWENIISFDKIKSLINILQKQSSNDEVIRLKFHVVVVGGGAKQKDLISIFSSPVKFSTCGHIIT